MDVMFVRLTNSHFNSINKAPGAIHGQLDKGPQKQDLRHKSILVSYTSESLQRRNLLVSIYLISYVKKIPAVMHYMFEIH